MDLRAALENLDDALGSLHRHGFGPRRPRLDVAVMAGLVADPADVDLQSLDPATPQWTEASLVQGLRECPMRSRGIDHGPILSSVSAGGIA